MDTTFEVRDQVLLDPAEMGRLRPRWEGPFTVAAVAGPNTYTLTLPRRCKCSPTVNVDRLRPYHSRAAQPDPPDPGPASDGASGPVAVGGAASQPQDPAR